MRWLTFLMLFMNFRTGDIFVILQFMNVPDREPLAAQLLQLCHLARADRTLAIVKQSIPLGRASRFHGRPLPGTRRNLPLPRGN